MIVDSKSLFLAISVILLFKADWTEAASCNATELSVPDSSVLALNESQDCLVLVLNDAKPFAAAQAHCETEFNGTMASGHTEERWNAIWQLDGALGIWVNLAMIQTDVADQNNVLPDGWYWVTPQGNYSVDPALLQTQNYITAGLNTNEVVGQILVESTGNRFADVPFNKTFSFMCEFSTKATCGETEALKSEAEGANSQGNKVAVIYEGVSGKQGTNMRIQEPDMVGVQVGACLVACTLHAQCRAISYGLIAQTCRLHYGTSTHSCFEKMEDIQYKIYDRI